MNTRLAHWLRRHTSISALLLFALLLRGLVPAGHMFDASAGAGYPITLCSGAVLADDAKPTADHSPSCPYALADANVLPSLATWQVAQAWPLATRLPPPPAAQTPLQALGRARLPRGPPVLTA
jgi:hypothetical protein